MSIGGLIGCIPETCRRSDAALDRNVLDAVKEAFGDLNDGLTGATRTHVVKKKATSIK